VNKILQRIGLVVVDQDYTFDPKTEDMLYGEELKEGMVVLADQGNRSIDESSSSFAKERNRWCEVSKLRYDDNTKSFYFMGLYIDGQKVVRISEAYQGWLVKLDVIESKEKNSKDSFTNYQIGPPSPQEER
jgi:hypothetical protein